MAMRSRRGWTLVIAPSLLFYRSRSRVASSTILGSHRQLVSNHPLSSKSPTVVSKSWSLPKMLDQSTNRPQSHLAVRVKRRASHIGDQRSMSAQLGEPPLVTGPVTGATMATVCWPSETTATRTL
jgi:hypothetical protein